MVLFNETDAKYFFCFLVVADANVVALLAASRTSVDANDRLGMPRMPTSAV